jgi:hypothetical protein
MSRHRFIRGLVIALAGVLLGAGPATASSGHALRLVLESFDFTGFTCDVSVCTITAAGVATSPNVEGPADYSAVLVVDFSLGGSCNEVDESNVFAFASGSILVHSHHIDCREHGWRIRADWTITGGTGAFAGATGGGIEMGVPAAPIFFNGTMSV